MALHNEKPSVDRLDKLARRVLAAALKFERAKREGKGSSLSEELCVEVVAYREAMVAELIGTEPTLGG